jgi:transcriptional regulator with XRE-family HTH domain
MCKERINPVFDNFVMLSPKQVELAIYIRQYRRIHELSQRDMAKVCSLYGEKKGIKFAQTEIACYENYKTIPTPAKFEILMNTMNITADMLM